MEFHDGQRVAVILVKEDSDVAGIGNGPTVFVAYDFVFFRKAEIFHHVKLCQKSTGGFGLCFGVYDTAQVAVGRICQHRVHLDGAAVYPEYRVIGTHVVLAGHNAGANQRCVVITGAEGQDLCHQCKHNE